MNQRQKLTRFLLIAWITMWIMNLTFWLMVIYVLMHYLKVW